MRIISANLNGIRSAANKGFFSWLEQQQADVVCLQELKAQEADLTAQMRNPAGWRAISTMPTKKGIAAWASTAAASRIR